jgi:coenzyme F420-reducing hydrogenase alpha subunit
MTSDNAHRDARHGVAKERGGALDQISDEARDQLVQMLRDRVREAQASEETRAAFVEMLLEQVREDPYPSRDQLDLVEESLPAEMVADYARVLMEKASLEPFPSNEILQRIQRMTEP